MYLNISSCPWATDGQFDIHSLLISGNIVLKNEVYLIKIDTSYSDARP